jgi:hypothetical protein
VARQQGSPKQLTRAHKEPKDQNDPFALIFVLAIDRMTPQIVDSSSIISEDEQFPTATAVIHAPMSCLLGTQSPMNIPTRWQHLLHRLTRGGPRGNQLPPLGQACLIMTGRGGQEEGQMGIITNRSTAMVEITYLPGHGTKLATKRKRPSSLILLGKNLVVTQQADGSVWVEHESAV